MAVRTKHNNHDASCNYFERIEQAKHNKGKEREKGRENNIASNFFSHSFSRRHERI